MGSSIGCVPKNCSTVCNVAVIDRQTSKNQDFDNIDLYSKELRKMSTKFSLTDIVEIVHKFTKINKNKIYKWLLELKK